MMDYAALGSSLGDKSPWMTPPIDKDWICRLDLEIAEEDAEAAERAASATVLAPPPDSKRRSHRRRTSPLESSQNMSRRRAVVTDYLGFEMDTSAMKAALSGFCVRQSSAHQ